MALGSIRLVNFKCFQDSGVIPLAPLTLIFGRNNAGKSSILQSLLLFRQTLDSPEQAARIRLRGPLYHAGTYGDIVHMHQKSEDIQFEFGISFRDRYPSKGVLKVTFSSDEPQPPRLASMEISLGGSQSVEIRRGKGRGGPYELYVGKDKLSRDEAGILFYDQLLPRIGIVVPASGRPNERRNQYLSRARVLLSEFETALGSVRAIGAFRRQPERRYDYGGRLSDAPDISGENVIHALIEDATRRGKRNNLIRSVNQWLKAVGRVRLLPLKSISKSARLYELRVKDTDSGRWANYADVGFGIGQALPVLVEGLRVPENGIFLVQEPEIHLHPDAQLAMADFLIDLANSGRQVIVETHSEEILLRVRRRMLTANSNGRARAAGKLTNVSIVHVSKHKDGSSQGKRLSIDELGQIEGWPADFMEETTKERMDILKAQAVKAK